ncbi:hypothetical protein HK405_012693 [Cladochytrium tenue]|nr:hypothetical protein HK405_012693 [Cladochytrium tenue]
MPTTHAKAGGGGGGARGMTTATATAALAITSIARSLSAPHRPRQKPRTQSQDVHDGDDLPDSVDPAAGPFDAGPSSTLPTRRPLLLAAATTGRTPPPLPDTNIIATPGPRQATRASPTRSLFASLRSMSPPDTSDTHNTSLPPLLPRASLDSAVPSPAQPQQQAVYRRAFLRADRWPIHIAAADGTSHSPPPHSPLDRATAGFALPRLSLDSALHPQRRHSALPPHTAMRRNNARASPGHPGLPLPLQPPLTSAAASDSTAVTSVVFIPAAPPPSVLAASARRRIGAHHGPSTPDADGAGAPLPPPPPKPASAPPRAGADENGDTGGGGSGVVQAV